jgi:glutamate formiminotransferase / 5-formyltetrahydrofolate cyclo-ligase
VLECVINVSEGTHLEAIATFAQAVADDLLDVHSDSDHNRSVFTLVGTSAPRELAMHVVDICNIADHQGVHPRIGVVDVVPFVALDGSTEEEALRARDEFAQWAATRLNVPCFLYGPERTLPFIRKHAWAALMPDVGPLTPHPTAGAMCVGVRRPLVAYNLWLTCPLDQAMRIAATIRNDAVRALGLQVGEFTQVSMNLVEPEVSGPQHVYEQVAQYTDIHHAELVGLLPARVLAPIPRDQWKRLDVSPEQTIEWQLAQRMERLRHR